MVNRNDLPSLGAVVMEDKDIKQLDRLVGRYGCWTLIQNIGLLMEKNVSNTTDYIPARVDSISAATIKNFIKSIQSPE